jgi:WD40 repeat protein
VNATSDVVCVGADNNKIYVYSASGGALTQTGCVEGTNGPVHSLAFSPNGESLAAGDVKEVRVWNVADWSPLIKGKWQFHTSRITGVGWSPNGEFIASAGTDENIFIWCVAKKMKRLNYKFAHKGGCVGVDWIADGKLLSSGNDGTVAEWDVAAEMAEKFK